MMNGIALQLSASAIALGLMGSAVGIHWFKVQEHVTAQNEDGLYDDLSYASYEPSDINSIYPTGEKAVSVSIDGAPVKVEDEIDLEVRLLQQMVVQMTALNNENQTLREKLEQTNEQVAETNRDLLQLQFRVNTHSDSFRPLRIKEDGNYGRSLPAPANSVLPPKDW